MEQEKKVPEQSEMKEKPLTPKEKRQKILKNLYDIVEVLATVTVAVTLLYAFAVRLQIVDGSSMLNTLHDKERLLVTGLCYEPRRGDIVIIHKIDADPYDRPIVKRVIATGGQTVDIDFDTWTLTVDGETVEEDYRWVDPEKRLITCAYSLPVTLRDDQIFVMGDNRNGSADSRTNEIGPVDIRCVVGKAFARVAPLSRFALFRNPFDA
ncbi:MAG: signal peptidase I [Clostridia bacterium]|nr:signal peptidase I [Clostridia bacterium]